MKTWLTGAVFLFALAAIPASAQPANQSMASDVRPKIGMGSKTMASCTQDIQRHCATSPQAVQNECLVRNWDVITSDCQDALGIPGGDDAEVLATANATPMK